MQSARTSSGIGAIILAGHDFPKSLLHTIQNWNLTMVIKNLATEPSTRGWLQYKDNDLSSWFFNP
jgi:hypothetical protein